MKRNNLRAVKILCIGLLPLLAFCPSPGIKVINAKVERVLDGDTVEIAYGSKLLKLRLALIDAPELKQRALDKAPIGEASRKYLHALVGGKKIKVEIIQKDRYGRYLALLFYDNANINLKMVEQGHALIYRYYEFQNVKQKIDFFTAEILAKRKRLGVWKTFGFYDPYYYRRLKRRRNARN